MNDRFPVDFAVSDSGFCFDFVDAVIAHQARKDAPGPLEIRVVWHNENARLEVTDRGPGYVPDVRLPDGLEESHRGLFIISSFGQDLRVERRGSQTITSVTVPVRRARSAGNAAAAI